MTIKALRSDLGHCSAACVVVTILSGDPVVLTLAPILGAQTAREGMMRPCFGLGAPATAP
jgi:hypothetical protein